MEQPVSTKILFTFLLFLLCSRTSLADSCLGRGTVFFFGNGMFNSKDDARDSLKSLKAHIEHGLALDKNKEHRYELAYKDNETPLLQLVNVVSQKGVDNYENFWFWLSSLVKAPDWFQEAVKAKAAEVLREGAIVFDE